MPALARGKLYLLSGDYEKAETELGNALELKDPAANLYLGRLFQAQDEGEEARSYYEAYLQDNPNDSKVLYELAHMAPLSFFAFLACSKSLTACLFFPVLIYAHPRR